ncbi:hypothetical protein J2S09_001297 [Bacillus fengqiuensis]|nr:hypothetical protein [Bacillus fengqiuensis]
MESLFPIGTIVTTDKFERNLMIYGRKQLHVDSGQVWDYVACLYPFGFIGEDYNIFFNHEDISKVVFKGFENDEEVEFRGKIIEFLNQN